MDLAELAHQLWTDAFADELVDATRRTLETGVPHLVTEQVAQRRDGSDVEYYEWRADRITLPGGAHGVLGHFQDISATVLVRKEIEQSREALRQADRRKSEFLAVLAHELRNPLAPIVTGLELLRHAPDKLAVFSETQDILERQTRQLVRLVDDLLDTVRISENRLELRKQPVELAEVVQMALETARPNIERAGHHMRVTLQPVPVHLDADPLRLAQVIANLLNNAAKYTPAGGHITLSAEQIGEQVRMTVKDTGQGISPEHQQRIFDLFVQLDNGDDSPVSGMGIGLTLVKALVELHGGTIEVYSAGRGQGTEFRILLPVAAEPALAAPGPKRVPAPGPRAVRRVLIADDNADAAEMLRRIVIEMGPEARVVFDGAAAVEAAAEFAPDLILMDLGMPRLNGYEAARRIRAQEWGKDIALVALTGWSQEEDRRRTREAGFDHHLVKPVDIDNLRRLMAQS